VQYGHWKFVHNTKSCSSSDCYQPQLFDLATDLSESVDVSGKYPAVFAAIQANFSVWYASVLNSIVNESKCARIGPHRPPGPSPPGPPSPPSTKCSFRPMYGLNGHAHVNVNATSQQECCGACLADPRRCGAAVYHGTQTKAGLRCVLRAPGTFTLKHSNDSSEVACIPTHTVEGEADREWVAAGN